MATMASMWALKQSRRVLYRHVNRLESSMLEQRPGWKIPLLLRPSSSLSGSLLDVLWSAPKGKGFDNFIPKNKRGENKEHKDDNKAEKESKDDKASEKKKNDTPDWSKSGIGDFRSHFKSDGKDDSNKNSNSNMPNTPQGLFAWILLAAIVFLFLELEQDDGSGSPDAFGTREITWSDFCIHLLESGQVEKIVVTNQKATARVFLKPGAPGIPTDTRGRWNRAHTKDEPSFDDGVSSISHHGDTNGMDIGGRAMSSESTDISTTASRPGGAGRPHQLVYRFAIGSVETFEKKLDEAQRALGIDPRDDIPVQYAPDSTAATELLSLVPSFFLMGLLIVMLRNASGGVGVGGGNGGKGGMGGIFQIGKSTAKKINKEDINISFKDVAGCQEAKKEIMEFVDFLKDSDRFTKLGAKIPKGALLCGPPGTGKTLLAKAVAGEAHVPFYSISGSDFIEMFVGVGPSRVRDLFKEARSNSPCIIFIDEIDAVGRQRGRGGVGGNDERENTLNQLLVEMDGFQSSEGVVVLAGTNRVDILDQALTRPGRFDRQITVDKPDLQGRKEIFQVHLQGITLEDSIDDIAGRLAGLTPGFAGADIANICNEAAIVAARRKAESVALDDFEKATDRIIGGLESNKLMSKEERNIVAHHEAGHAVAGWFLEHADPLLKVTIIPRTSGALGYAQYLPKEVFLRTQDQIMDIVCMALAGRAAEEIFFGRVTTGASDDLKRVTQLVYSTIQVYGMNSRLGQLAFPKDPNAMFEDKPYSDATAKAMDEEAKAVVDAAYQRTLDLLREKKSELEKVATRLLEQETITHDDITELIGPRPFVGDKAYNEFISRKQSWKQQKEKEKEKQDKEDEEVEADDSSGTGLSPGLS